uniref:Uncharacterized protein n=1 Tax=Parastrongyloides trichosuri TaxID=131310 RepID=A0A0N4ZZS4_PARTI
MIKLFFFIIFIFFSKLDGTSKEDYSLSSNNNNRQDFSLHFYGTFLCKGVPSKKIDFIYKVCTGYFVTYCYCKEARMMQYGNTSYGTVRIRTKDVGHPFYVIVNHDCYYCNNPLVIWKDFEFRRRYSIPDEKFYLQTIEITDSRDCQRDKYDPCEEKYLF